MKRILKNKSYQRFLIYLTSGTISKVLPFLILTLTTTVLTTHDFGLISNFTLIVEISASLMLIRMDKFVELDYYKLSKEENDNFISNISTIISLVFILLIIIVVVFQNQIEKYTGLGLIWTFLAILTGYCTSFANLRSSLLRLSEKAKKFASFQLLNVILLSILTIALVFYLDYKWIGRIVSISITAITLFFITLHFLIFRHNLIQKPNLNRIKTILRFSLPLLPFTVAPFLKQGLDKIFITNIVSMSANGVYSLALSFSSIFDMFVASLFAVYTPMVYKKLSSLTDLNNNKLALIKQAYKLIGILILIEILGFFVIRLFVTQFLSKDYFDSLKYLPYLLIHVLLRSVYLLLSTYVLYSKKTKEFGFSALFFAIIHSILSFFLIKQIGIAGALISLLILDIIRMVYTYVLANKYYPMPWWSVHSVFSKPKL